MLPVLVLVAAGVPHRRAQPREHARGFVVGLFGIFRAFYFEHFPQTEGWQTQGVGRGRLLFCFGGRLRFSRWLCFRWSRFGRLVGRGGHGFGRLLRRFGEVEIFFVHCCFVFEVYTAKLLPPEALDSAIMTKRASKTSFFSPASPRAALTIEKFHYLCEIQLIFLFHRKKV